MNMSFDFGKWLLEMRKEKGLSQSMLAEMIMSDSQNISNYEHGRRSPNLWTVNRILDILGYEITVTPKNDPSFKKQSELINKSTN